MKTFTIKQLVLLLLIVCSGFTSITMAASCPKNTHDTPVNFIYVVLDNESKGLPVGIVISPNIPISGKVNKTKNIKFSDHKVKQKDTICWQAVVQVKGKSEEYKLTKQKIAVLWQPGKKINFSFIVKEKVPENSPVGIIYKYTIATEASDPSDSKTYLDPRILITKR